MERQSGRSPLVRASRRPWQTGKLSHSGDEDLDRHIAPAVVKVDARGSRITRESRYTTRRIDLAVAAVIAHDMACDLMNQVFRVW